MMFIIYENLSSLTAYIIWILLISNMNFVSLKTARVSLNYSIENNHRKFYHKFQGIEVPIPNHESDDARP